LPVEAPTRPSIPFEWGNDIADASGVPEQLVEGLLTVGGMSMVFGPPNSGKTYLALAMGLAVASGNEFLGKRVERGAVIYIAGEGSLRGRLFAHKKHFGRAIGAFGVIPTALNLMDPSADVDDLVQLVPVKVTEIGEVLRLIIIDTVARAMFGGDENSSEDMARLISAADHIRGETGAHVLFVHHSGKDAAKGARGHSSLRAAVDTEIEVTADDATKTHTLHVTKQRDLPSKGLRLAAKFVSVEVGHDQWGGVVTACAVEQAELPATTTTKAMGPAQQAVLGYLAGREVGLRKTAIVAALEPQGVARASVYRAINNLLELGLVTDTLGLIYRPKD